MARIASVVVANATREFDKEYDYIVPETIIEAIKPGIRVIVPFGRSNKSVEGYVVSICESSDVPALKEVKKCLDDVPVLSANMLKLAYWMKKKYICTFSDAIKCMIPPGIGIKSSCIVKLENGYYDAGGVSKKIIDLLKELGGECEIEQLKSKAGSRYFSKYIKMLEEAGHISLIEEHSAGITDKTLRVAYIALPLEEVIEHIESDRIKKIQQIRVLEMLIENEYISVADILRFAGVSSSVLNTLKKYGYIDFKDIKVNRDPLKNRVIERTQPLKPTVQQEAVLHRVKKQIETRRFGEFLLHGVTGSGKTEVYLQLIEHCLKMGKQAIVLVPEISLTPQMVERFKGRFGNDVAVLHSRLSLGERYDQWKLIRDGKIKVAVGARSAVFAPFEHLGIVIIDEEHESSYKSETTPKYNARDVAKERCLMENAVILYGSATPSVESYYSSTAEGSSEKCTPELLKMDDRANKLEMPEVEIVDLRKELEEGNRSVFSRKLSIEIEKNISLGQQTILFLNRRGYSSFVLCRNCGYTVTCPNCNVSMTYHAFDERLICHYCGYTCRSPQVCPKCKSNHIRYFGTGTQRIEDELRKQFNGCSVIRMDMDTTTRKNSHEIILRKFREENINIMVGTQMIAKGHDFPNVTLVGVLAADSLLNTGDYRASERTFQLITQVAGRAGRGEVPGRVVIQSYNTEDFSILSACRHDYEAFYQQEIKVRERLNYPPFTNIASIVLSGANDKTVFSMSKQARVMIKEYFNNNEDDVVILGPSRAPLTKINNKYRWRIVIKCKDMDRLINVLSSLSDDFYKKRGKSLVDISVDINPVSML